MKNLLSYCRLVDARISATEKDLPVSICFQIDANKDFSKNKIKAVS